MRIYPFVATLFFVCSLILPATCQSGIFISYNIRFDNPADGVNAWAERKDHVTKYLNDQRPLAAGLQEVVHGQLEDIMEAMPGYGYVGVGRDDGKVAGEYSPIIFDTAELKVLDSGTFWLSESGDTASIGWDAAITRICTYAKFQFKENESQFWLFNTHFDHVGKEARVRSADMIVQKTREINQKQLPVVLTGDFNSIADSQIYASIISAMDDAGEMVPDIKGPVGTWKSFDPEVEPSRRIDYVFVRGIEVNSYAHEDPRTPAGLPLSDHLPVIAALSLN